jgi:hypothetical protein
MEGERTDNRRTVYHVTPDVAAVRWVVYQENGSFRREYDRKEDAVYIAKLKAQLDRFSRVKVHNADGRVDYEATYGEETGDSSWSV